MVGIPNQSSNPNMYSLLLFCVTLLIALLLQKGNIGTILPAPPFHFVNNYSRYLIPYKFAVLSKIAVPYVALSCGVIERNSPSLAVVVPITLREVWLTIAVDQLTPHYADGQFFKSP